MLAPEARPASIAPPEPELTPDEMLRRARELRPLLRVRQAECEALGRVPEDVSEALIRAGFFRIIQPRRFGGYEFDVPTFLRVMMEISRGCPETGWVVALVSGHPLIVAHFPEEGQREVYGADGEFRCPAAFNPPGNAVPVEGGYRITGSWPSASGCDLGTHFLGSCMVQGAATPKIIEMLVTREQYRIVDDWQVMGMRGTGSKRVVTDDAFVPTYRTIQAIAAGRGAEPAVRVRIHENAMYWGRILPFLIGESAAASVGGARGALDVYEEILRSKKAYQPPYQERFKEAEFQQHYGQALALIATAEAALVRVGQEFMEYAAEDAAGGAPFDEERAYRVILIEDKCIAMAWQAMDLIYRTVGTSHAAKDGQMIGRMFRNLAVMNTHPALQLDRAAIMAARVRFGLQPPIMPKAGPD
jgi:3-hydroxy-9,10-secoandrosta-1,3,5(10)-triene-9,17-dione monooxygenase